MKNPKPFLAFDVDGTIFKSSLLEKIITQCIRMDIFTHEDYLKTRELHDEWQRNNNEEVYQEYISEAVRAFNGSVRGMKKKEFKRAVDAMIKKQQIRKFAFAQRLIQATADSHSALVISGSAEILVRPFVADLGIEEVHGSKYYFEDGLFTEDSESVGPKDKVLDKLVSEGKYASTGSIAVGDTITDIPMLAMSDHPIMFNASKALTEHGVKQGWIKVHEVKDQITVLKPAEDGVYREISIDELFAEL